MSLLISLDQSLFQLINQRWISAWADVFFPLVTDLNKAFIFQVTFYPLILLLFLFKFRRWGFFIFAMCAITIIWSDFFGNVFLKQNFERPRPFLVESLNTIQRSEASGYSFISNHATNTFAFATFTSTLIPMASIPAYGIAFIISYSRVYNGVHYPSDVLFGAVFGILWGLLFAILTQKILLRFRK